MPIALEPRSTPAAAGSYIFELHEAGLQSLRLFDVEGYEQAVSSLREALMLEPDFAPAHAALAETYAYWGFRREIDGQECESYYRLAYEHAERALHLAPRRADCHRAMAVALRRGESADAERRKQEVLRAIELDPDDAESWYEQWRALGYNLGDAALQRALELDPRLFAAQHDLGVVLCEHDRLAEAERHLRDALRINPRNSLGLYNLAMVLQRQGRGEVAEKVLQQAKKIHPDEPLIDAGLAFEGSTDA